ncbi:MAG: 2,3-bisphosphoglycerate-independent phosphoglycerate mutase, partial [Alphaproteobacteria bacterium]|nr:2,3-bisphosphoglycerate-independent phosphoglycerate mutase [Alphaproteobacteria bacterium]
MTRKPVLLCILDGWGMADISLNNPIGLHAPKFYELFHAHASTVLDASGLAVGLPQGQMGNSEVGHTTMGLGRVCMQDLPRISQLIESKDLFQLPAVTDMIATLKHSKKTCHLMGLLSMGGVHAHKHHIEGILDALLNAQIPVCFHAILDGRDSPPQSALKTMEDFLGKFSGNSFFHLASISGRYYAMDRDNRFERTELAYDNMMGLANKTFDCPIRYIQESYAQGVTDEFILPARSQNFSGMHNEDALWMANFRADRVRQILNALLLKDFTDFKRQKTVEFSAVLGMNAYSDVLLEKTILQPLLTPIEKKNALGEVISKQALRQLRI